MVWESRCYFDGIPDSIPKELRATTRVPSYQAIAVAILKNDHNLYSVGFSERASELVDMLIRKSKETNQMDLFK